jgi:MFS family permease
MDKNIAQPPAPKFAHASPMVFLILAIPYGLISGYVTVAFAYLYSKAGISVEAIAALVGASLLPQILKFLWVPLVDTSLTLKKWYVLSGIICAATILATGVLPVKESSLPLLTIIIVLANVASSFNYAAATALAAHDTPHELRGRVGGFLNAGNLGGSGIGGGAGLWLAQHLSQLWMTPAVLAGACILCCMALWFVEEHVSTVQAEKVITTLENLFKDIWSTLSTKLGILALVLCFLPIGTVAAANLFSAVAGDWKASADTVALVTGVASGLITAAGCFIGGFLCDLMDRRIAYVLFGGLQIACALAMAYTPHTEWMYIIWTSAYAVTNGLCYAAFSAFVFEAISKGAAATKYTVYGSLSNLPIYYMTIAEGWSHTHYGPTGMLNSEAILAGAGCIFFLLLLRILSGAKMSVT